MKLSDAIRDYRLRNNMSQREFSIKCGLSNTYISFLEKELNPKTGRPMVPTLEQYKKVALGMDLSVQQLFELLDDDSPVDLRFVMLKDQNGSDSPVIIDNIDRFSHLLQYMTPEDYNHVIAAFDRAYKKMKEKGVKL